MRSAQKIAAAKAEGRPALIAYLPAGFPDVATTIDAAVAVANNGVDIIEIGIPYSDPVMDGEVIQQATTQALGNGFRVSQIFEIIAGITARCDAAVMVMTYWNPVLRMGVEEFARRFAEAGGSGLITPDLVPDEAGEWVAASEKYDLERVFLIAPSSSQARVKMTVQASSGFVYCVSVMGVTGARSEVSAAAQDVVAAAHAAGAENACVGLGVSKREHVQQIGAYADGVIVGTALVAALRDGGVEAVGALAAELSGRASA
ncbi:Tryptophan synthase alpha chain [Glutamicibacter creatinolyticus]|uniref:Tryptophan synthase alpha chain n=1 Tax=Glutamicibacter creatinolyticus TaxID=162496 RepID=A0A5B7WVZ8_9MICC|nr:Tryptophan synthase alpha chain [Glutamicibacter creatinolyticus]